jgi:hypothetical protein
MKMGIGCCKWHLIVESVWLIDRTGYVPKLALTGVGIAVFAILSAAFWFSKSFPPLIQFKC